MVKKLNIFRADRKGNETSPERFVTDGLLSKQPNGGDPLFYQSYGWIKAIKNHIDVTKDKESIFLYETTSFLSFSENEQLVRDVYLKGRNNKTTKISSYTECDAYIFSVEIKYDDLQEIGKGIYFYDYNSNYDKFRHYISEPLRNSIGCNICSKTTNYVHRILILNATDYLSKLLKHSNEFQVAFENAKRDSEWLIMPLDPMDDGIGYQSRIPVAYFWNVEYFKYLN